MLVEFKRLHELTFDDGRIIRYDAGTVDEIEKEKATALLEDGVVRLVGESSGGRETFLRSLSKSELQELCRNHIDAYMPSVHRNVDHMIDLIMAHEEEHGLLIKDQ